MTDMEKLELRRETCEAINPGKDARIEVGNVWICDRAVDREGWISKRTAPAVESDNGLALDALVKWCNDRVYLWILNPTLGLSFSCQIYSPSITEGRKHVSVTGETPAIAISRAIVAAATKEK